MTEEVTKKNKIEILAEKPEKYEGLLMNADIYLCEEGRYLLSIAIDANDGFTKDVFVMKGIGAEREYTVRGVSSKGVYRKIQEEDKEDMETTRFYYDLFDTYDEAYSAMINVAREVAKGRARVRQKKEQHPNQEFHILI